ncbi:LOW QUALITY PROTEIN: hypothetical protein ACHAW6_005824 [Cyclotella cf. meneghiniana]
MELRLPKAILRTSPPATSKYLQTETSWKGMEPLEPIGFTQSQIEECLFYRDDIIFIVYVDDGIFLGSSDDQLSHVPLRLRHPKLRIKDSSQLQSQYQMTLRWLLFILPIHPHLLHHFRRELNSKRLHQTHTSNMHCQTSQISRLTSILGRMIDQVLEN